MARTLNRLSVTLGKILKARGMQSHLHEYRIASAWAGAVGTAIARHAQPTTVRGGKLTLVVDSPAWMQQLSLLKPEIIGKLNNALGSNTVKDITLRLGEVERRAQPDAQEQVSDPVITQDERENIDRYVRFIGDDGIREAMRRLLEKDVASRKSGRKK